MPEQISERRLVCFLRRPTANDTLQCETITLRKIPTSRECKEIKKMLVEGAYVLSRSKFWINNRQIDSDFAVITVAIRNEVTV